MDIKKNLFQLLLLLYSGLIMVISAFMLISFPIGAYTVFNTEIGDAITYQHPIELTSNITIELGEGFIVLWCIYLALFSILLFKNRNILHALLISIKNYTHPYNNKLAMIIVWFAILLVGSKAIDFIQQQFGIEIGEIKEDNLLLKFFNLTTAPLKEEPIFRIMLIGLPTYLFFTNKRFNYKEFLYTLWLPSRYVNNRKVSVLIITSAVIFGLLHILSGWEYGKFTQSTFAGILLGFVYYRYGLHASIILHWSANYFLTSYGLFTNAVFAFPWDDVINNPLLAWLDLLLTTIGIIGLALYAGLLIKRFRISLMDYS
ncbi:MAG: hypothetical protein KatS3mg003_1645 [Candidatus Nitrosocaldaceae archaeon]|nr:MAG: hypothetical protein KatS3mg003_1645 [Candidatus Nitrosocaldaceae archaeon]